MVGLDVYSGIAILLVSSSATTLCLAYFGVFRHLSALWLSLTMAGLSCLSLSMLVTSVASQTPAPSGPGLIWWALGIVLLTYSLPRFLLSAFGRTPGKALSGLLYAVTAATVSLAAIRTVTGWESPSSAAAIPGGILRVVFFAVIAGSLGMALLFQSRLPDRSLYRAIIVQACAQTLLVPFLFLEDTGLTAIPGFPSLASDIAIAAASVTAILHARTSLKRPSYVEGGAPSEYFVERFGISGRELEVVSGVMEGLANQQIAERLFISPRTVEKHLSNIYQKAGIRTRLQLYNLLRSK